jgi:hypothetical protein
VIEDINDLELPSLGSGVAETVACPTLYFLLTGIAPRPQVSIEQGGGSESSAQGSVSPVSLRVYSISRTFIRVELVWLTMKPTFKESR